MSLIIESVDKVVKYASSRQKLKRRLLLFTVLRWALTIGGPVFIIFILSLVFKRVPESAAPKSLGLPQLLTTTFSPSGLAGLCALIAFLTSAIVQLLKDHGGLRTKVHQTALEAWLKR